MKRCLLIYYSYSSHTRQAAIALAQACGADLEELHEKRPRRGLGGYVRSLYEVLAKRTVALEPIRHDPADYAVTIIGTPVWAGAIAAPMRSFLAAQAGRCHSLAAFCTMGASGGEQVLDAIGAYHPMLLLARLALRHRQLAGPECQTLSASFARTLQQQLPLRLRSVA